MIFSRFLPWLIAAAGATYLMMMAMPSKDPVNGIHLAEFATIPVVHDGRPKPFDTLARNSLMVISGRQYVVENDGKEKSAMNWLLDVMTSQVSRNPSPADKAKVFRIENDQVLDLLALAPRSGFRYAIEEFSDKLEKLEKEVDKAKSNPKKQQDKFDAECIELARHLERYIQLARATEFLQMVPPETPGGDWLTIREAFVKEQQDGEENKPMRALATILSSYAKGDIRTFNQELATYQQYLKGLQLPETRTIEFEVFFNHFEPFIQCCVLYVCVFVLACLAFLGWTKPLGRSAFWLAVITLAVHMWALFARMYLMDRWFVFVTNLYSSAVFIGFGAVIICLILEIIYPIGIGNLLAAVLGAVTLYIGHHLASTGDTLHQLEAVLDTNLWLATHVSCVTFGYTATFVAGFLGMAYIVYRMLGVFVNLPEINIVGKMIYGILCFATLLSFTGTVLGGIWADQSWGRFWGWDPKENGALLIVLMNALILHARWAGLVKQRGMAVLAVCGNMVTGWSWFGTNQLGVGLHAYGFNNTLATGLTIFWLTQLGFIVLGLIPLKLFRNFAQMLMPRTANGPHAQRKPEKQLA